MIKCSFCGHQFQQDEGRVGCRGCPVSRGCGKVKCPNCGFEMPLPPRLPWLRRVGGLFRPVSRASEGNRQNTAGTVLPCLTLASLRRGEVAEISQVDTSDPRRLKRLLALGVLPGTSVRMVQTYPSYVFDIGHTSVAVDEGTANAIYVRVSEDPNMQTATAMEHPDHVKRQ